MAGKIDDGIEVEKGADDSTGNLKSIGSLLASGETGAKVGTTHLKVEITMISIPRWIDGAGVDSDAVQKGEIHPVETFGNAERVAVLLGRGYVSEVAH